MDCFYDEEYLRSILVDIHTYQRDLYFLVNDLEGKRDSLENTIVETLLPQLGSSRIILCVHTSEQVHRTTKVLEDCFPFLTIEKVVAREASGCNSGCSCRELTTDVPENVGSCNYETTLINALQSKIVVTTYSQIFCDMLITYYHKCLTQDAYIFVIDAHRPASRFLLGFVNSVFRYNYYKSEKKCETKYRTAKRKLQAKRFIFISDLMNNHSVMKSLIVNIDMQDLSVYKGITAESVSSFNHSQVMQSQSSAKEEVVVKMEPGDAKKEVADQQVPHTMAVKLEQSIAKDQAEAMSTDLDRDEREYSQVGGDDSCSCDAD